MFEKNLKLAYLLDFYGDVLDEHTRAVMKAYYDDDLSLGDRRGCGDIPTGGQTRHQEGRGAASLFRGEARAMCPLRRA